MKNAAVIKILVLMICIELALIFSGCWFFVKGNIAAGFVMIAINSTSIYLHWLTIKNIKSTV